MPLFFPISLDRRRRLEKRADWWLVRGVRKEEIAFATREVVLSLKLGTQKPVAEDSRIQPDAYVLRRERLVPI